MNILVTLNDGYITPLLVMLDTLFRHQTEPVDIYLIYSSVSQKNLDMLTQYIRGRQGRFIPIAVKKDPFEKAPVFFRFPREMYYRLLCGELLPETLDRVLYLDPDIMIRGSLDSLYHMNFQGKTLIGIIDNPYDVDSHRKHLTALGLCPGDIYINSGVLLFDLDKMRNSFKPEAFAKEVECRSDILKCPDQDMINIFFRGRIGLADGIYNYPVHFIPSEFLSWIIGGYRRANPVVVHYAGEAKPWNTDYIEKYYFEYRRYHRRWQTRKERIDFELRHLVGYLCTMMHLTVGYIGRKCMAEKRKTGF